MPVSTHNSLVRAIGESLERLPIEILATLAEWLFEAAFAEDPMRVITRRAAAEASRRASAATIEAALKKG